jgi:excisionase family DNA binding protein
MKRSKKQIPLTPPSTYLTVLDAVHETRISRVQIYKLLRHGVIRARKLGRRNLIERASLEAYVNALPMRVPTAEAEAPPSNTHSVAKAEAAHG